VVDGYRALAMLDMGWREFGVAVEYDGDHHRSDRRQYVKDQWRLRKLAELGWIVIRVIAEDTPENVIERVRPALLARGWQPKRKANASSL
jgi:very-short-patch-repair endonuclease